jgi:hypothetical protein
VTIYWSPVAEATGYILQKSVTTPTINGSVVIQAGAWTTVSAEQKLVRNSTYASSVSIVVEDDVSFGSVAQYRLIVQTAKGTAGPSDPSSPVSMIDFDTSSYSPYLNVQTRTVRADDSANYLDTSVVAIVFEVYETRSGYTHSIYRQARGEPNGDGYDAKGDYELVPGIAANFEAAAGTTSTGDYDAVVKLQYNPELPRQKYSYQLRWYKDGEEVDTQNYSPLAAKSPITYYYVTSTSSAGASTNEIRWYGVESTNLSDELISVESISIYGRRDPNQPTAPVPPNQNQPSANTTLIGVAEYCDGTTAHPWPTTDALSSTPGYWVSASAYYDLSTLTAEVK